MFRTKCFHLGIFIRKKHKMFLRLQYGIPNRLNPQMVAVCENGKWPKSPTGIAGIQLLLVDQSGCD